ncbi:type II membrane protein [Diaporthe eres]|uniref:Autophagy-related protein 27 n=1 Tax=Diaporthe eres TaxID=83184 RepID=A0ABR1PLV6_DIAER
MPTPATAMLQCDKILIDRQKFNFKDLGGPHSVVTTQELDENQPFQFRNTTYTLDLCAPLKKDGPTRESCPNGARVCGIVRGIKDDQDLVQAVIPIAGNLANHGGSDLEPKVTRLKTSDSGADAKKEGVRLVLHGGKDNVSKRAQQAIVEMVCDKDKTGKEGEWDPKDDKYEPGQEETEEEGSSAAGQRKRADGDENKDGSSEHQLLKPDSALIFDSYGPLSEDKQIDVLRLTWYTKYACEGLPEDEYPSNQHWGFFTWLVILVFLATASYLIFGSWLNYNRYGARGWDLLPHSDTIRDIPYLLKDWTRRVLNTVQGTGSRGGYSAV